MAIFRELLSRTRRFLGYISRPFIMARHRSHATAHPSVLIHPSADIQNLSHDRTRIVIKSGSVLRGQLVVFAHGGRIEIGTGCFLGEGSRIWSADSVKIGDNVLIAHNVNIHDTNAHPVDPSARREHFRNIMTTGHPATITYDIISRPVVIEDNAWIGFNATILKGVTVGRNSIVGACSVVTADVPSNVVVAGNPARIIGRV